MLKGKELHTKYMRIAEIMVTDEYPSEEDKIFAIAAVCHIAMSDIQSTIMKHKEL